MKNLSRFTSALCLSVLVGALSSAPALAQSAAPATAVSTTSKNILFEGSFAEHAGGIPVGWSLGGFAGGSHGNTSKVTEDRDGNYVSLFISKMEVGNFTLNTVEPIPFKPTWKKLLCSYDVRVFNYVQGEKGYQKPRMQIVFIDAEGKTLSEVGVSLNTRYTDAWQTAESSVAIPVGAVAAKLWVGTFGSTGQLDFRNIYVAPVE